MQEPASPNGDISVGRECPPIANSQQEKRILDVLEEMCRDKYSEMLSVPPEDGRVLRLLAEATGARHIVEVGTSNGYASIWFCLALRTTGGKLTTFEIDATRASLARENFKRAGVDKLVTLIEGDAHKKVTMLKEPIDIVFIDADKSGYLDYLNKLLPLVRPGGVILAHNTTDVGSQMRDYLEAITTNSELETIFLHKQTTGIGVTLKKRRGK
jgi:predicted O-methyltransferase YrrM